MRIDARFRSRDVAGRLLAAWMVCLLAAMSASGQTAPPAFRAFWVSTNGPGAHSQADLDNIVARAIQGNYNVINYMILWVHDPGGTSHGAYWNSSIVPRTTGFVDPIDPLAYLVQQTHAAGLKMHVRVIPYVASVTWPPNQHTLIATHPEWITVMRQDLGNGPADMNGCYMIDPGSPEVQEYVISIIHELLQNYEIDGIHLDFIRYLNSGGGYPSDLSYMKSSLARFQAITGYNGIPPASGESAWDDFRRRTIDELVRRVWAEIAAAKSHPRQPISYTAAVFSAGSADFTKTSAWAIFQNWEKWMRLGWIDAACPMNYRRDHITSDYNAYRNGVDYALGFRHDRHIYMGQCLYRNSMANTIIQMQYALDAGCDGVIGFSYGSTADENLDDVPETDWSWYPYVGTHLYTEPAATPDMPWRNPATATQGTLWGRVTDGSTGEPVDDAEVTVAGLESIRTDANGYYVVTMIPATVAGTNHAVTVDHLGYTAISDQATVVAADITRLDVMFDGPLAPVISEIPPGPELVKVFDSYARSIRLDQGTADSWTLVSGPPGASISPIGQISGWTPEPPEIGQSITFVVQATNSAGSDEMSWQVTVEGLRPCLLFTLTDFEAYGSGAEVLFRRPRYSGTTRDDLATSPDSAKVTREVDAFSGDSCLKVEWQYVDTNPERWMRLTTSGAPYIPNPTMWLDTTIRVRLRLDSGRLRLAAGIREIAVDPEVGENGGTTGPIEWVGAASAVDGAPQGVLVEAMPGVWQTVVFNPVSDPVVPFTGDGRVESPTGKGTFEELAFSIVDTVGPFTVYIDDVELLCPYPIPGDWDEDGDVDQSDFGHLQRCLSGDSVPQNNPECQGARLDADSDVDQLDFAVFQGCMGGDAVPGDPFCAW